eukprot:6213102-Pleurochrysis_carterae.AAC.3
MLYWQSVPKRSVWPRCQECREIEEGDACVAHSGCEHRPPSVPRAPLKDECGCVGRFLRKEPLLVLAQSQRRVQLLAPGGGRSVAREDDNRHSAYRTCERLAQVGLEVGLYDHLTRPWVNIVQPGVEDDRARVQRLPRVEGHVRRRLARLSLVLREEEIVAHRVKDDAAFACDGGGSAAPPLNWCTYRVCNSGWTHAHAHSAAQS